MSESNSQTDQQKIIALVEQEVGALSGRIGVERFFDILTDDAVLMPPGITPKKGTELRGWLRDFVEHFSVEWMKWVSLEVVVAGDMAFHSYAYSWRVTRKAGKPPASAHSGAPTIAHGKGLHIFRREPGGPWKLAREMWNSSPSSPEVAKTKVS